MKKNFLFGLFATAMLLLTTACQKENDLANGNEVMVNFEVSAPVIATRAYSDGETAKNLQYAVYSSNKVQLATMKFGEQTGVGTAEMKDLKAKVSMRLALGNEYYVLFWADAYTERESAPYTVDFAGKTLTVNYDGAKSNDENRDAFYCWKKVTDEELRRGSVKIEMRRPFAQLNIGTGDTEEALASGVTVGETAVKVKAYQTMDFVEGRVSNPVEAGVQFDFAAKPVNQTFPVDNYDYLAMNYLLVGTDKEVVNEVVFKYTVAENNNIETRTFTSIPLRRNYRTNIYGNLLTQAVDFNVEIKPAYENENAEDNLEDDVFVVSTDNELKAALAKDDEVIRITLADNVSLNVSDAYIKLGTENTKSIIIDGAGIVRSGNHTLTLATTYWSRLNTVNPEACIVLKNLNLTSTQATGTWNSYDVTFQCNVELENVTLNKALALDNEGKKSVLKNVTINETHDYYAMWISAAGQHVSIDGLTINAPAGRGIKIDEQYVDAPSMVTLDVKNATFTTAKKAAIVVKSAAGAEIGLNNINLEKVAADQVNAVWVDEDAAEHADKVIVKGGTKVVEGAIVIEGKDGLYRTIEEALANATANDVILLPAGEYVLPSFAGLKNGGSLTYKGFGTATIVSFNTKAGGADGGLNCYADGTALVFDNLKVVSPNTGSAYSGGFGRATSVEFSKCTYVGQYRACAPTKFNLCVIDPQTSYIYTDYYNADFVGCTFNASEGKAIQVYNDGNSSNTTINISNCTFTAAKVANTWDGKPVTAIDINSNGEKFTVNITATTATGFGTGLFSGNGLWNIKGGEQYVVINIDSKLAYPYYTYDESTETYTINSAKGLFWFANEVNVNKNAFNGKTVKLTANIDLEKAAWTPIGQTGATTFNGVFDGCDYTISNLNVNSEAQTGKNYSSGLFGWVESHTAGHGHLKNVNINGATIVGHHNCGALVGYITQETALVENCHVTGATVTCTHANNDADGDKAGALIGNATEATPVKDCTASNSTVSAGRDAGQLIGAGLEANVTDCSATNVTVAANGTGTGANVRNEVIGRLL